MPSDFLMQNTKQSRKREFLYLILNSDDKGRRSGYIYFFTSWSNVIV